MNKNNTRGKRKKKPNESRKKYEPKMGNLPVQICPKCNKPILEISEALCDKTTGAPVHFDCVLEALKNAENIPPNCEVIYLGNGQFGVVEFPNPKKRKEFKILKTIKWEDESDEKQWRNDIRDLFEVY